MTERIIHSLLRRDFAAFIEKTFSTLNPHTKFLPNWHIDFIARDLCEVNEGRIKRLIINIPPRHLKSICVNVAWPAWLLGNAPTKRIISASFNHNLASKHSQDCRFIMQSEWFQRIFPTCQFAHDQNTKDKFVTTQRGFRFATSVFGAVTGEGGDILIIDDPMSPEMAHNVGERKKVIDWFDQTFSTRLDDKKHGAIVLVMQRLHEDDLSGVLLKRGGWDLLSLPVMNEDGILLHEAREGWDEVQAMRSTLGEYGFAAQYMQEPMRIENGMIKRQWLKYYDKEKLLNIGVSEYRDIPILGDARIVQSWDTAIKATANADYTVGLTFGIAENNIYLIDIMREQMEYPDLKRAVIAAAEKWQPEAVLVEDKASGQSLLQDLRRETKIACIGINPKNDKVTRMSSVSPLIEAGRFWLPSEIPPPIRDSLGGGDSQTAHPPYIPPNRGENSFQIFEAELLSFPNSKNDDQVDALSQFLNWFKNSLSSELGVRRI